jgi:glutathione-independent formaldehyde dehydrogenase
MPCKRGVASYNRALIQAILWDRIKIAETGVQVILLDEAPRGYAEFDAGAPCTSGAARG